MAAGRTGPTWAQRLALIGLGLAVALVTLEVSLRLGGALWTRAQRGGNDSRLRNDGAIRVLCLGESTTAYGYPAVLEQVLNDDPSGPAYHVFNEGVAGTTTDEILARLPDLLDRYTPDVVVAMIGINDPKEPPSPLGPLAKLRVFELYTLLAQHLGDRWAGLGGGPGARAKGSEDAERLVARAADRRDAGDLEAAHDLLVEATRLDPDGYEAWRLRIAVEAARLGSLGEELVAPAVSHFGDRLVERPTDLDARMTLARLYLDVRAYERARALLLEAPGPARENQRWRRLLAATYEFPSREAARRNRWVLATAELEAGLAALPPDAVLIRAEFHERLARAETVLGRADAAARHASAASDLRSRLDDTFTAVRYRALLEQLRARGIPLVASQYPGRDVDEVREMLDGADDVVFVDNGPAFREAVRRHGFWRVYDDEFAGDFGHMTNLGKEILARNVAPAVRRAAKRKKEREGEEGREEGKVNNPELSVNETFHRDEAGGFRL